MNIAPVAYRYARSLMDMARTNGGLEGAREDMELVATVARENRELVLLLKSPVVKADRKGKILERVFAGKIGTLTMKFMDVLLRKGREALLPDVAAAFTELYKIDKNVIVADVRSAVPLNEKTRQRVKDLAVAQHPGKTVEIKETVDPSLIGGLVIRIGDEQYDGSVSRRIQELKRKFSENPYIPEI